MSEQNVLTSSGGDTYHNRFSKDSPYKGNDHYKKLPKKCAKCGTTKGPFDIHHKSGNRKSKKRSDLMVLCRSCHRKLHDGKGNAEEIISTAARIIIPDDEQSRAIAKEHKNSDLMYVEFILCHVGANNNHDMFEEADLKDAAPTAINKPINWEHTLRNIGVIYDSQYVDVSELTDIAKAAYASIDSLEKDFVVCKGVVWEYKHPDEARVMRQRHEDGTLAFSMENLFKVAKCTTCGGEFAKYFDYCDHLLTRYAEGSTTNRVFKNSNLAGAGVVKKPADKDALSLAVASDKLKFDYIFREDINTEDVGKFIVFANLNKEGIVRKIEIPDDYKPEFGEALADEQFADDINRAFPIDNEANILATAKILLNDKLDFYNKNELIYVLTRLNEAANAHDVDIKDQLLGGNMDPKEFENAVSAEVDKRMKELESGKKFEELNGEIASLKDEIKKLNDTIKSKDEEITKAQTEFATYKGEIEQGKLIETRTKMLTDKGFAFDKTLPIVKSSIGGMTDEAFASFVEVLVEAKGKTEPPKEDKKDIVNESKEEQKAVANTVDDKEKDKFKVLDKIFGK